MHLTSFLDNSNENSSPVQPAKDSVSGRESVKILVIGSSSAVMSIKMTLHHLGFAEVGEWSPLLLTANPGEVMSILTRYIVVN